MIYTVSRTYETRAVSRIYQAEPRVLRRKRMLKLDTKLLQHTQQQQQQQQKAINHPKMHYCVAGVPYGI
jgi:hypothetical protein